MGIHSLRFKFFAFFIALLLILFLLLNSYPLISSRDAVFEEKKSSLSSRATAAASALSRLDGSDSDSIAEVIHLLDMSDLSRVLVSDGSGSIVYDTKSGSETESGSGDIYLALSGKTVFRSNFENSAFTSSYTTPINYTSGSGGALMLYEIDTERAGIILSVQNRVRYIAAAVCVVSLLTAALFFELVLRRIGELSGSMKIVSLGDYAHRLTVRGRDELSELGDEFNLLTERLQSTEIQRRRFVSDASHELKTPIASIRLLSDSIVESNAIDTATIREFAADISHEAERLQNTTEKLLDLSRLDDDIQMAPEPVDMKQVALDALAFLKPVADDRNVKIHCALDDGCVVMATTDDMYHTVFNLMENAVKYNVPGGKVDVSLSVDEKEVHFCVSDTGIGIPEEDRLNIFTRFYRVDKARSREAGGSGLGLSIVHDAVHAHKGTITVGENAPCGSVFTVTFPRPSSEETGI